MEVDPVAAQEWFEHSAVVADSTVFRQASSWYAGANVEGKPRRVLPYLGGVGPFRAVCDEVAADGYRGLIRRTGDGAVDRSSKAESGAVH